MKLSSALAVTTVAVAALAPSAVQGFQTYVARVPNSRNVPGVGALGHVDPDGGGPRNPFGMQFAQLGYKWNTALCTADSDKDGATNGEELGDPCCKWKEGDPALTAKPTHPGVADTFTPDQLKALKCPSGSVVAPSGSSSNGTSSTPSAGGGATTTATPTTATPTTATPDKKNGAERSSRGLAAVAISLVASGLWMWA